MGTPTTPVITASPQSKFPRRKTVLIEVTGVTRLRIRVCYKRIMLRHAATTMLLALLGLCACRPCTNHTHSSDNAGGTISAGGQEWPTLFWFGFSSGFHLEASPQQS